MLVGAALVLAWSFMVNLAFLALQLGTMSLLQFEAHEATVGMGPRLGSLTLGSLQLTFRALPIVSHVALPQFHERLAMADRFRVVALYLLPWVAFLILTSLVLGFEGTVATVRPAWHQALAGLWPFAGAAPLLRRAFVLIQTAPLDTAARLTAKLAFFNLLPLPSLAGARALLRLLSISPRVSNQIDVLGMLLLVPTMLGWALSFVRALIG